MDKTKRRDFLRLTGMAAAAALVSGRSSKTSAGETAAPDVKFSLGLASYSFRNFKLDETIAMTRRLGLTKIAFKDFHLPLDSTAEHLKAVAEKVSSSGLDLYGCGVVYMKSEEEVRRAFEYARAAGMRMIIGVPEHHLLGLVEQKVKSYDIQVAIHNHGPGDERYPSPESAYERIRNLDRRIGLCLDIGHTQRLGIDPGDSAEMYADRLLDVHIKDVSEATGDGSTIEIGRGVIDIPKFLTTLMKINYTGIASFEFEKDKEDPLPGIAESVGYVRGALAVLQRNG